MMCFSKGIFGIILSSTLLVACGGGSSNSDGGSTSGIANDPTTTTGGTDTSGTDTSGSDASGTDTSGTDTSGTDTGGTDTGGTDTGGTDSEVNTPPEVVAFIGSADPVMVNDPVQFEFDIVDAENDAVTCSLDVDGDAVEDHQISDCSGANRVTHFYHSPGSYVAKLTVTDADGNVSEAEVAVTVLPIMVTVNSVSTVSAGSRAAIQLRVSNLSQIPVNNVRILHRLPKGYSYRYSTDVSPNSSGCYTCVEGNESTWQYDSLAAGENRLITINVLIDDDLVSGASISAPFIVSADGMQSQITLNKTINIDNKIVSQVELFSSQSAVSAASIFDMKVAIGNIDNVDLSNAQLRLTLPQGASVESVLDADGVVDENTGDVVWNIGTAKVLQSQLRSVSIKVDESTVNGTTLPFRAQLSHDNGGGVGRSSELALLVTRSVPAINLELSALQNPVVASDRFQMLATISNTSLVPVRDVVLLHRVPAGVQYRYSDDVSPNSEGCYTCTTGDESYWEFGSLAAGQSYTIAINASISDLLQGGSILSMPFTVSAPSMNWTLHKQLIARIDNLPQVQLTTQVSNNPIVAGEQVQVHVDIGNVHSQALQNGELALTLPSDFSLISVDTDGGSQDGETGSIVWSALNSDVGSVNRYSISVAANTDLVAGSIGQFKSSFTLPESQHVDKSADAVITISEIEAPLQLEVSTVEATATPGSRLRYVMKLSNNGLIPIKNTTLALRVPYGMSYRYNSDATPDSDGCYTCVEGGESYWEFDSIAAGASETIELNSNVSDLLQAGSILSVPFSLTADGLLNTQYRVLSTAVK